MAETESDSKHVRHCLVKRAEKMSREAFDSRLSRPAKLASDKDRLFGCPVMWAIRGGQKYKGTGELKTTHRSWLRTVRVPAIVRVAFRICARVSMGM